MHGNEEKGCQYELELFHSHNSLLFNGRRQTVEGTVKVFIDPGLGCRTPSKKRAPGPACTDAGPQRMYNPTLGPRGRLER